RGLYCMRHFEAGDQILAGQAFTVLCPARLWLSRCCVCFLACEDTASGALQPCSKCKAVAFCSQKCADADRWHAWECQAIPDAVRICGQLTHNLADQGSHEKGDLLTELLIVARALRVMHSFPSAFTQRCEDASVVECLALDLRDMAQSEAADAEVTSEQHNFAKLLIRLDCCKVLLPPVFHESPACP
ncbi:unnamed protein product, partial [Polarella glacialis]